MLMRKSVANLTIGKGFKMKNFAMVVACALVSQYGLAVENDSEVKVLSQSTDVSAEHAILEDGSGPSPFPGIQVGRYESARPNYFTNVNVKRWADLSILNAVLNYEDRSYSVQGELFPEINDPNRYNVRAEMVQEWNDGLSCTYRVEIEVFARGYELYIQSYQPGTIQTTRPQGSPCPNYRNSSRWVRHEDPYVLRN